MSKIANFFRQLKEGILDNNPVLVQLLGMCPVLATTTSVENALGMGAAATAVLICSNIFISLLRKFIPSQVRIAAFIVIISGFVTAVELIMRAYFYSLYQALGLFIPLIVVNCIILARAEAFASRNKVLPSAMDGIAMGLGFTFALVIVATIREVVGAGTFMGIDIFGGHYSPVMIMVSPPGAFLTLGLVIAVVQKIRNTIDDKKRLEKLMKVEPKKNNLPQTEKKEELV
ncbi:MAG: electron transport complex subunit E [Ruminococcaceae bacterium]|nr:electron transport complex subunit E [Oscillospiraceae bacterium]